MAAVLKGVMGSGGAPWFLYVLGAVFAGAAELCGVSGLAFALGMYLPMDLNSPLVVGAAIAWWVQRSSKDKAANAARHEEGTLISSGFIAGGALVGVFAALLKFFEDSLKVTLIPEVTKWGGFGAAAAEWANWNGLIAFLALGAFVAWRSVKKQAAG